MSTELKPTVAIIGGGPSGLRAARELGSILGNEVLLIDRERQAGGIPRHANHPGYGVRDLNRFMSGPAYAKRLVNDALDVGARIQTSTQAIGWTPEGHLRLISPHGLQTLNPDVLILATGARERPRPARMIPGDRGAGIYTTGQLQQLVHLKYRSVGKRAVIVGGELVSWSAALTLREAGCHTVALITQYPRVDSYLAFSVGGSIAFRTKALTSTRIVQIKGKPRVTGVTVENTVTGARTDIACDTLVFTGDWIPDNELARMASLQIDYCSLSPIVDASLRTSQNGIFAIGNLVHPVETADVAALDGAHVKQPVLDYLAGKTRMNRGYDIRVDKPLRWVSPARIELGDPEPARGRLVAWTDQYIAVPTVTVRQAGQTLERSRLVWPAAPGRAFRIPVRLLKKARLDAGDVTLSIK